MLQYIASIAEFLSNLMKLGKWNVGIILVAIIAFGGTLVYAKMYVDDLVNTKHEEAMTNIRKLDHDTTLVFGEMKTLSAMMPILAKDLSDAKADQRAATQALLDMQKVVMDIYKNQPRKDN